MGQTTAVMALIFFLTVAYYWLRSIRVGPDQRPHEIRNALIGLGFAIVFGLLSVFSFVIAPGPDPTSQSACGIALWPMMTLVALAFVVTEAVHVMRGEHGDRQSSQDQVGESSRHGLAEKPPDEKGARKSLAPETSATDMDDSRVDDPQFDPWAGMHGAFTATPPDLRVRHDEYLAKEDPE